MYDKDEQSGPTAGFGTFTTPIPTSVLGEHPGANPYAIQSIQRLLQSRTTARPLLEGIGVDVDSEVSWEERNHDELTARPSDLLGQNVDSYVLTNGVLRTGDERRAVLLLIARAKSSNPVEILFAGASLQQFVESGENSSSFREEYGQRIIDDFAPPMANITQIDPDGDLPGL